MNEIKYRNNYRSFDFRLFLQAEQVISGSPLIFPSPFFYEAALGFTALACFEHYPVSCCLCFSNVTFDLLVMIRSFSIILAPACRVESLITDRIRPVQCYPLPKCFAHARIKSSPLSVPNSTVFISQASHFPRKRVILT